MHDELYLKDTASNAKTEKKIFITHSIIEIVPLLQICAPCVSLRLSRTHASLYRYWIEILWGN
jgi:hypothetical protein